jgi:hypothetical protein
MAIRRAYKIIKALHDVEFALYVHSIVIWDHKHSLGMDRHPDKSGV